MIQPASTTSLRSIDETPTRDRPRARLVMTGILLSIAAMTLASCKASTETGFWFGDDRCVTKQATIGETADQDASGNVSATASTKSRFGSCSGDRSMGFEIYALETSVDLVKVRVDGSGTFVCGSAFNALVGPSGYELAIAAVGRCGYGNYFSRGGHEVIANSGPDASSNSQSPNGYNA